MLGNLFGNLPPVTQVQLFIFASVAVLSYSQLFSRYELYFSFDKIFFQGQVSTLINVLGLAIAHKSSLFQTVQHCVSATALFSVFFVQLLRISISSSIERSSFKRGSIDYMFFQTVLCLSIYVFATVLKINFLSNIYSDALLYYYGRINANQIVLINLIPVRAPFIVWIFFLIDWLSGNPDLKSCIISIILGHSLFFIYNVFPKLRFVENKDFFDTPGFLQDLYNFSVRSVTPLFNQENAQRQQLFNENDFLGEQNQ